MNLIERTGNGPPLMSGDTYLALATLLLGLQEIDDDTLVRVRKLLASATKIYMPLGPDFNARRTQLAKLRAVIELRSSEQSPRTDP